MGRPLAGDNEREQLACASRTRYATKVRLSLQSGYEIPMGYPLGTLCVANDTVREFRRSGRSAEDCAAAIAKQRGWKRVWR